MSGSLLTLPLRLSLRGARSALRRTRDLAEVGLDLVDLVAEALGAVEPDDIGHATAPPESPAAPRPPVTRPVAVPDPPPLDAEVIDDEPWTGYDALRAADVVARVRGADPAELAAIELYETGHRRRRTVLEAVAREARRAR